MSSALSDTRVRISRDREHIGVLWNLTGWNNMSLLFEFDHSTVEVKFSKWRLRTVCPVLHLLLSKSPIGAKFQVNDPDFDKDILEIIERMCSASSYSPLDVPYEHIPKFICFKRKYGNMDPSECFIKHFAENGQLELSEDIRLEVERISPNFKEFDETNVSLLELSIPKL